MNPSAPLTSPLPPAASAALSRVTPSDQQPDQSGGTATATVKVETGDKPWYHPGRYLRMGVMSLMTLAIVALIGVVVALFSYIVGTSVGSGNTAAVMAKDAPIKLKFQSGYVESYGFIRNFLFRNDDKTYEISTVMTTDHNGGRDLKDTNIKTIRENGDVYQLKAGTNDVWVLLDQPARPPRAEPMTSAPPTGGKLAP